MYKHMLKGVLITLDKVGHINTKIVSDSMIPTLEVGSIVKLIRLDSKVRVGDIVAMRQQDDSIRIHRIVFKYIKKSKMMYVTKPDNGWICDLPFEEELLIAKVDESERKTRYKWWFKRIQYIFLPFSFALSFVYWKLLRKE